MDTTTAALESLSTLLTSLSESPYSLELHAKHVQLALLPELADQIEGAVQLLTNFYAATDQVWLPFFRQKAQQLGLPDDLEISEEPISLQEISVDALLDVMQWFRRAENDYLSVPILETEIKLLILLHNSFVSVSSNSELDPLLSEDAVRAAIASAVLRGSSHLTQGHVLWELQIAWELARLAEKDPKSDEWHILKTHIASLHLERLQRPHSTHDKTLQSYSSFVSAYCGPEEYEPRLVEATKIRARPEKAWNNKERYELRLVNSPTHEVYHNYIMSEQRVKPPNVTLLSALHERVLSDFAGRRWDSLVTGLDSQTTAELEDSLRFFWCNYIDSMRSEGELQRELPVIQRAIRSVPGCGEVWSRYIRALERQQDDLGDDAADERESVADVYARALSTSLIQTEVRQIVPLVLARGGFEKRHLKDQEDFLTLIETLQDGIVMVRRATNEGDSRLTLEKFLAGVYMNLETPLTDQALELWQSTAKHYKTSFLAWSKYIKLLIAQHEYARARALFKDVSYKSIDWPEAIWQLWAEFEHLHGSVEDIEHCLQKTKGLSAKLERTRAQEAADAQKAWLEASGVIAEAQDAIADRTEPMDLDSTSVPDVEKKRKAEEVGLPEASKRVKLTEEKPVLKRDRENSTVFVTGLVAGTAQGDLTILFKDCGEVREIKITNLDKSVVATVEFMERGSVLAALTKDKKRLKGEEIAVHLAWRSTLYVTNFPDTSDDASIRELFGSYGEIFDVRWPSKKYKNTRRFCYVQYTSPSAAISALSLHGFECEPGRNLTVYISDPQRKQERSDASANAREVYVAGLSKSVNENDLRKLFEQYGSISSIRLITDDKGDAKGFAFVEFDDKESANAALAANNQELKKRRVAVTLADMRVQPRQREGAANSQARRSRTVRIKNLPPGTQEGLLQQTLAKHAKVIRIEVFQKKNEAVVELDNAAEVGRVLLNSEPIVFGDRELQLIEEDLPASSRGSGSAPMFAPRGAAGRPRAGIGSKKTMNSKKAASSVISSGSSGVVVETGTGKGQEGKGQDDFRRMLNAGI